jgi:hypothetical protein
MTELDSIRNYSSLYPSSSSQFLIEIGKNEELKRKASPCDRKTYPLRSS